MNRAGNARERARTLRARAYREAVCEAAEQLFAERGIDATKMEDVSAAAGLSLATVYSVFSGGKSEIVHRIHRERLGELAGFAVDEAARGAPAPDALRRAVRSAISFFVAHPDYLRMHLREGHAWFMPMAVAAHARQGAESWEEGVGALIEIIDHGIATGAFRAGDARRAAKAVVTLEQLHLAEWIEEGEQETADEVFARFWSDVEALLGTSGERPARADAG
jgi:AcrR family transcriptional regulator